MERGSESYLHNAEKVWYEKVKSKRTGEFYQAEDLIKREFVPPDWESPYTDATLHQFMNTPFEELIQWASTPTYRLDRAYKDQLEASHIG